MSEADDRYNHSAKGRARHRRYNRSSKGRSCSDRYEERHVVLAYVTDDQGRIGKRKLRVSRTPEAEAAALRIAAGLADLRARQHEERRRFEEEMRRSEHLQLPFAGRPRPVARPETWRARSLRHNLAIEDFPRAVSVMDEIGNVPRRPAQRPFLVG